MQIIDLYKPYNFSITKCFVIPLTLYTRGGISKIEEKLPPIMKHLKGLYITARNGSQVKEFGYVSLNFNEGAIKTFSTPVFNSAFELYHTSPMPADEELKSNTSVQGYYMDLGVAVLYPINIKIYLHYTT